jgi:hypothetical protein
LYYTRTGFFKGPNGKSLADFFLEDVHLQAGGLDEKEKITILFTGGGAYRARNAGRASPYTIRKARTR